MKIEIMSAKDFYKASQKLFLIQFIHLENYL